MMSNHPVVSVQMLQINQKTFTLRLRVVRVGSEINCGSNSSTRIHKMIMIDDEGVQIGVIMFNDDVNYLATKFKPNKTYLISNGEVKRVNPMYPSAHPEKELVLKKYTIVKDVIEGIQDKIRFNFIQFKDIEPQFHKDDGIDIYGIVTKVKDSRVVTNSRGATKPLREITLMNQEYHPIVVSLWEDLAINEGYVLHQIEKEKTIVGITKLIAKRYYGEVQLQTTAASVLQIQPITEEIDHMRHWSLTIPHPVKVLELSMKQRMKGVKEVTLQQILHNRECLTEDTYYCFKGFVEKVLNKPSLWYDSCKNCSASIFKNDVNAPCKKCNLEDVETTPRYRLVFNVTQGNDNASVTIFDDAATVYVGCPIEEYITSTKEGEQKSKYYRGLSLQESTEFRFLFALNRKVGLFKENLNVVADGIERLKYVVQDEPKEEMSIASIESKDIENTHDASLKVEGTRKKRLRKKNKEDDIKIISSDDEETISSLKKKCAKRSFKSTHKKISPPIKIKQEKS